MSDRLPPYVSSASDRAHRRASVGGGAGEPPHPAGRPPAVQAARPRDHGPAGAGTRSNSGVQSAIPRSQEASPVDAVAGRVEDPVRRQRHDAPEPPAADRREVFVSVEVPVAPGAARRVGPVARPRVEMHPRFLAGPVEQAAPRVRDKPEGEFDLDGLPRHDRDRLPQHVPTLDGGGQIIDVERGRVALPHGRVRPQRSVEPDRPAPRPAGQHRRRRRGAAAAARRTRTRRGPSSKRRRRRRMSTSRSSIVSEPVRGSGSSGPAPGSRRHGPAGAGTRSNSEVRSPFPHDPPALASTRYPPGLNARSVSSETTPRYRPPPICGNPPRPVKSR